MVFKLFELSHVTCRGALFRKWIDVTQVVHDAFSVAGEKAAFENMLKQYPEGIVAVVSDSYVLWPSSILKSLKVSTAQSHWTLAWILQCCRHDTYLTHLSDLSVYQLMFVDCLVEDVVLRTFTTLARSFGEPSCRWASYASAKSEMYRNVD